MQDQEKESRAALGQSPVSLCMDTHSNIFELILQTLKPLPGEGNGNPLQYSCLENPVDTGAWWAAVHGVTQSRTRLSDYTFIFNFHALATHSSILALRIPGMVEPGELLPMGSHGVGHD